MAKQWLTIDWYSKTKWLRLGTRDKILAVFPYCVGFKTDSLNFDRFHAVIEDLKAEAQISPHLSFEVVLHENDLNPTAVAEWKEKMGVILSDPELKKHPSITIISINQWREKHKTDWKFAKDYFEKNFSPSSVEGKEMRTRLIELAKVYLETSDNKALIINHLQSHPDLKQAYHQEYARTFPEKDFANVNIEEDLPLAFSYVHVKNELIDTTAYAQRKSVTHTDPTQSTKIFYHKRIPDAFPLLITHLNIEDNDLDGYFSQTLSTEKYNWTNFEPPYTKNREKLLQAKKSEIVISIIPNDQENHKKRLDDDDFLFTTEGELIKKVRANKLQGTVEIQFDVADAIDSAGKNLILVQSIQSFVAGLTERLAKESDVKLNLTPSKKVEPLASRYRIWKQTSGKAECPPSPEPKHSLPLDQAAQTSAVKKNG